MTAGALLRDRRLWSALAAVAAVVALRASGLAEAVSLETLARHREALVLAVAENRVLAAAAYLGVYVAAVAFSVPGAVLLTLAGGLLFGPVLGTALAAAGATTGAALVFLFARLVFGENALSRLGPRAEALAEAIRRNAAFYLLALRLVPVFPFFLVNLVPAFVGVGLPVYVATTLIGILPGTAVFSLAGAGLGDVLAAGGAFDPGSVLTPRVVGALAGLAALALAAIPIKARLARPPPPPR